MLVIGDVKDALRPVVFVNVQQLNSNTGTPHSTLTECVVVYVRMIRGVGVDPQDKKVVLFLGPASGKQTRGRYQVRS